VIATLVYAVGCDQAEQAAEVLCCVACVQVGGIKVPELLPFNVWGDVGSDLPEVDNFSEVG
jgi:hypothetical protein